MSFQIIGFTVGVLLCILGLAELIPASVDWADSSINAQGFLACAIVSMFFGGAMMIMNKNYSRKVGVREAFILTNVSWLALSFFSAFPLVLSDVHPSFVDALFESVSGITTTGSTVFVGLDYMSQGVLLWRSITQWIGGVGIVAFAIVLLPFLRVGGMQLFRTESSDRSEKILPQSGQVIFAILFVYCILTGICAITYGLLGMSFFDAVNHAMTTLPTGGYSTHDSSFGYFKSPVLELAATFFMALGGLPFVLFAAVLYKGRFNFFKDEQVRAILIIYAGIIGVIAMWLWLHSDISLVSCLQTVAFNVVSVITTTGFASTDYTAWGQFAVISFFFMTYLGACAGSTAGGIKTMRLIVAVRAVDGYIKQLLYPRGVFTIRYQGQPLRNDLIMNVLVFLGLYLLCNAALTLCLTLTGLDFITAVSGAATAIANVGPGVGTIIGPAGNFATLPDSAKLLLCFGMLLGRLEIMTILVLFAPAFWRR